MLFRSSAKFREEGKVTLQTQEGSFVFEKETLTLPNGMFWSYETKRELERIEALFLSNKHDGVIAGSDRFISQFPRYIQVQRVEELSAASKKVLEDAKLDGQVAAIEDAFKQRNYTIAIELANAFLRSYSSNNRSTRVSQLKIESETAERQILAASMSQMRTQKDEVEGITWYNDKTTPQYDSTNNLHLYIGQKSPTNVWLRLRIRYTDDDWLFIRRYTLNVDGTNYTLEPSYTDVERDNSGGKIWEWYDINPSENNLKMIDAIIASSKTILRCEGRQYHEDRIISAGEKKALQNVLYAYKYLNTR